MNSLRHFVPVGLAALVALAFLMSACGGGKPEGRVFFIEPEAGGEVVSPFRVRMGIEGLGLEPAGEIREGYGHHHIVIDVPDAQFTGEIPKDLRHLHFGKAQTETMLELGTGGHTLKLLFADGDHIPFSPEVFDTIKITVIQR